MSMQEPLPPPAPPREESARAFEAWQDYWNMGPQRSLRKQHDIYVARAARGEPVPTKRLRCLEEWSSAFRWKDRVAERLFDVAKQVDGNLASERTKFAQQRLSEARTLHGAAGAILAELVRRLPSELAGLPFRGYWTAMEFAQETIEQDWEACPGCLGSGQMAPPTESAPALQCPTCAGSGRKLLGKGRRKVSVGTRIVKIDGLVDLAPILTRMMDVGHKLERTELGPVRDQMDDLLDAILGALPEPLRGEVLAGIAGGLTAGKTGGGGGPQPPTAPRNPRE